MTMIETRSVGLRDRRRLTSSARWARARKLVLPAITVVVLIALYQTLISAGVIDDRFMPGLPALGTALGVALTDPATYLGMATTIGVALAGFLAGAIPGALIGLISGRNAYVYRALRFTVEFLRPIPAVALVPLVSVILGPTVQARIFLCAFMIVWPFYIQAVYGVRAINPVALETARSFGVGRTETLFRVVLPSASAYIATVVRLNIVIAVLVSVSTEILVTGTTGLGSLLIEYGEGANVPGMYAMVVIIAFVGMLVLWGASALEKLMLFWHESHRGKEDK